jgi:hypothetical protein
LDFGAEGLTGCGPIAFAPVGDVFEAFLGTAFVPAFRLLLFAFPFFFAATRAGFATGFTIDFSGCLAVGLGAAGTGELGFVVTT